MVASIALIYLIVAAFAWFWSERLIFQPQAPSYTDTKEILKIPTRDGTAISAVWLPHPGARLTILYSHGNAEDLGDTLPLLRQLERLGFNVFGYDYHGYGTSPGRPTEAGVYDDVDAAFDHLTTKLGVPEDRIVAFGWSVGGGPTLYLAAKRKLAGVIVQSTFTTTFRVLTRVPIFPFDRFANLSRIGQVRCPVLIMHGRADGLIPFRMGEELFAAANEPKTCFWVEGAGHNDLVARAGPAWEKAVRGFAATLP
jgi:fermentation-respiration switch protein FrsA (DUF1100 family)